MPDISFSITANASKGRFAQSFAASGVTASMSTAGVMAVTLSLGTTTTQITTTTLGALGLCFAQSLATESTHTVSFGRLSGTTLHETVSLRGGEAAVLRLAAGDYAAKAAVAGSRLVLQVFEG
jgi:hypothetical protein